MCLYKAKSSQPLYKCPLKLKSGLHYGLFGGSFNPVHQGHLGIANYALHHTDIDKIIWMVTPRNPFKDPSIYRPYKERFEKVQKAVYNPNFTISNIEHFLQPRNSYETLSYLRKRYPHIRFTFILGSDSLSHTHTWHFFPQLVQLCEFLIIVRPTHRFNIHSFGAIRYFKQHKIRYRLLLRPFYFISSTEIRNAENK